MFLFGAEKGFPLSEFPSVRQKIFLFREIFSFVSSIQFSKNSSRLVCRVGGDEENRTPDPLLARQVLSQLSYTPMVLFFKAFSIVFSFSFAWKNVVGLTRLELVTSRLSGVRSNQLSYRPIFESYGSLKTEQYFEISDVRPTRS